jgi:hypothetical protein
MKQILGYNDPIAVRNREILQAEINKNKVNIDFTGFKKTKEERLTLKQLKKDFKK